MNKHEILEVLEKAVRAKTITGQEASDAINRGLLLTVVGTCKECGCEVLSNRSFKLTDGSLFCNKYCADNWAGN